MRYLIFSILLGSAVSVNGQSQQAPLQTVAYVDPARYAGKWYEIASFPQRFQKGCHCTTAEYVLKDNGKIDVTNSCNKDGKRKTRTAKAKVVDPKTNARLSVQFFWPFKGKYWIIDLADDYSYAVVGHPGRDYLWILSRTPQMKADTYRAILDRVKTKGYDIARLQITDQQCNIVKQ